MVAPYVFPGWLSRQWVIGVGRSPKVTQMYMEIVAFPSQGTWDPANPSTYTPPRATMDIWLEWWLPAGYFGGTKVLHSTRFPLFCRTSWSQDSSERYRYAPEPGGTDKHNPFAAPLPRVPDADSPEVYCYWANQLLQQNNQGIDFAGNPGGDGYDPVDHDQHLAREFHDPFARINPASQALGNTEGSTTTNGLIGMTDICESFHCDDTPEPIAITGAGMAAGGNARYSLPARSVVSDATCKQMRTIPPVDQRGNRCENPVQGWAFY